MQKSPISLLLDSSCLKSFEGNPTISKPASRYLRYMDSNPSNCGVNPHLLAVFTTRIGLSRYSHRSNSVPCSVVKRKSWIPSQAKAAFALNNRKTRNNTCLMEQSFITSGWSDEFWTASNANRFGSDQHMMQKAPTAVTRRRPQRA